jgi:hypothetical protein
MYALQPLRGVFWAESVTPPDRQSLTRVKSCQHCSQIIRVGAEEGPSHPIVVPSEIAHNDDDAEQVPEVPAVAEPAAAPRHAASPGKQQS